MKNINKCYDICHRAKQARQPFSSSSIKTQAAFQLIHCDVWGLYHTPFLAGAHYFLSIIDDFIRTTWVYLMKSKLEVYSLLTSFIAMIHKQFGCHVK